MKHLKCSILFFSLFLLFSCSNAEMDVMEEEEMTLTTKAATCNCTCCEMSRDDPRCVCTKEGTTCKGCQPNTGPGGGEDTGRNPWP